MRTFIAIFPPPEVQEEMLRAARSTCRQSGLRWIRPENVHLTLKFLGETPDDSLAGIPDALNSLSKLHAPFEVEPRGLGAFPSPRRARILWAGVGKGSEALRALAKDVEDALDPLGFERDGRPYVPHATLGRAKGRPLKLELPEERDPVAPCFLASRIALVESVLRRDGVVYEPRATFPLEGPPRTV